MERNPVIIEAAINGNRTKEHNPNVPRSHAELAEDTLSVLAAGASIIHNHGSVFGDPRKVADDYLAGWMPVFSERPDALRKVVRTSRRPSRAYPDPSNAASMATGDSQRKPPSNSVRAASPPAPRSPIR